MIFSASDIQKILENVDLVTAKLVARVLGKEYLTKFDIDLLKKRGVDLLRVVPKFPTHYQSFLFGRLTSVLGDKESSGITYSEFSSFLSKMGSFSPTRVELDFYRVAANKTYTHIKGLGDKIKNSIQVEISAEEMSYLQAKRVAEAKGVIKKEILDGEFQNRSVKRIASNIAHKLDEWDRDWGRIVATESQDVFNLGRTQAMMRDGSDPKVFFNVYPGACKHCIRLYLTNGIGSEPKVFTMSELMANGSNVGLKTKDWRATIHPVHPYCRCTACELPEGYVWDSERGQFVPPKNYKRKVDRKSKVKIDFGNKHYEV